LNEEAIKRIKDIEKVAVKKIFEVMNDKNNQGTVPYFSLIISDTIGATLLNKENQLIEKGAIQ
jgi:hypothetical protein